VDDEDTKVHVLPGSHPDIFDQHRTSICRLSALGLDGPSERQINNQFTNWRGCLKRSALRMS
jgi:hypothetical protein